jgi:hypothetical protein
VPDFQPVARGKLNTSRISKKRVKRVWESLNPNKSANGISNQFLKMCSRALAAPITSLFQRVFFSTIA